MEDKIQSLIDEVNSLESINNVFVRIHQNDNSEYCITFFDDSRYLEYDTFFDVDASMISIPSYNTENMELVDEFFIPAELFIKSMPKFIELIKLLKG